MISFSTVTKKFPDGTVALEKITFDIDEGELILITGHSGSGKTTLMKLLIREYLPTKGDITFLENKLSEIKSSQVPYHRRQIGVAFQDYKLLHDLNVWENIALPLYIAGKKESEIEERVTDLLKLTSLTDKALMFPVQLSGGEAQRVSIARALSTGPKVIFADEPTGNLDPQNSLIIVKLLRKINELGTTVMLATHDAVILKALENVRRVVLEKGKMIEDSKKKGLRVRSSQTEKKTTAKKQSTKKGKPKSKKPQVIKKKLDLTDEKKPEKKKTGARFKLPGFKLPFKKS